MRAMVLAVIVSAFVATCGNDTKTTTSEPTSRAATDKTPARYRDGDWNVTEYRSDKVKVLVRSLTDEAGKIIRDDLSRASIKALPLSADDAARFGNVNLFVLEGSKTYAHDVFVVPRLFVLSSALGGRASVTEDATKQLTVRFPVAIVDGLSGYLSSGLSAIPISPEYKISDAAALKVTLSKNLGFSTNLRSITNCPEHLTVTSGDDRLEAKLIVARDVCPLNQLIEISVTGARDEIQKLLEQDLAAGSVKLTADFSLSPQYAATAISIEVESSALTERLHNHFAEVPHGSGSEDPEDYTAKEVRDGIAGILLEMFEDVGASLPEAPEAEDLFPIMDTLIAEYFEAKDCAPEICFRFRTNQQSPHDPVLFEIIKNDSVPLGGDKVSVSADLKPALNDETNFIIPGENTSDAHKPEKGVRGGLLRPARDGDLIELKIGELMGAFRDYPAPILDEARSRLHNPVCVRWGEPPMRAVPDLSHCVRFDQRCVKSHKECVKSEKVCEATKIICSPSTPAICWRGCCGRDHKEVCDKWGTKCVKHRDQCDKYEPGVCREFAKKNIAIGPAPCIETENHWLKVWQSSEVPSIVKRSEPLASFDQERLLSDLKIELTHFEPGETGQFRKISTVCPLSVFSPAIEQTGATLKMRFRIENTQNCSPFNEWNRQSGREPELMLINALTIPHTYQCGSAEESWDGKMAYACPSLGRIFSPTPIFDTYYQRFELRGSLNIPGARFISTNPKNGGIDQ